MPRPLPSGQSDGVKRAGGGGTVTKLLLGAPQGKDPVAASGPRDTQAPTLGHGRGLAKGAAGVRGHREEGHERMLAVRAGLACFLGLWTRPRGWPRPRGGRGVTVRWTKAGLPASRALTSAAGREGAGLDVGSGTVVAGGGREAERMQLAVGEAAQPSASDAMEGDSGGLGEGTSGGQARQ